MKKIALSLVGLTALATFALADDMAMPAFKKQATAKAVVDEHIDALNRCDWNRLMAQYPNDIEFILPNGTWVKGRAEIGKVFTGFCKDRKDGGFKGATFIAEEVNTVGDTINVSWRVEADWLASPYKGGDAYVTKDGMMQTQVTTFNPADMKFK